MLRILSTLGEWLRDVRAARHDDLGTGSSIPCQEQHRRRLQHFQMTIIIEVNPTTSDTIAMIASSVTSISNVWAAALLKMPLKVFVFGPLLSDVRNETEGSL